MNTTYKTLLAQLDPTAPVLKSEVFGTLIAYKPKENGFYGSVIESYKSKRVRNFRFKTCEEVEKYFVRLVETEERVAKIAEQRKVEKKISKQNLLNKLQVGTILHGSWGYDQTNCEYFIVREVKGNKVKIQELSHISIKETGWASCQVMPDLETPRGEILERTVASGWIKLHDSCSLSIWDGKSNYSSWYA